MRKSVFLLALFSTLFLHGQNNSSNDDMEALRKWLRDKRMVSVKEIGGDLSISGEIRTELQYINERMNDIQQRGTSAAPKQSWDVEFNLMMDYRSDYTWASAKLEYDDSMGTKSGTTNKIRLERAYLGGRIISESPFTFDAEIGRRFLYNVFFSKVEFASLYDGALIRLSKTYPSIGNFYWILSAFIINENSSHYGYITELGAVRIANTGLDIKYTLVDWHKHFDNPLTNDRFNFIVSQLLVNYLFTPDWIGNRLIKLYSAAVYNHLARGVSVTAGDRAAWAWYTGVAIGMVRKAGDWAIEADYQWVEAQAVPDFDMIGIGRGNTSGVGLYTAGIDGSGSATTISTAVGSGNFQGYEIDALYAFTDNLTMEQSFKISHTLDVFRNSSGTAPNTTYKIYEVEFIYGF